MSRFSRWPVDHPGRVHLRLSNTSTPMISREPQLRLSVILSMWTFNVSPGSAPSMKNGPVCGFARDRSSLPVVLSVGWMRSLDASRVLVTTVSPEAIRAAGGWEKQYV